MGTVTHVEILIQPYMWTCLPQTRYDIFMIHKMPIKIYYEDTDAGGVVYHANYLKFMERARTEILSDAGFPVHDYHARGMYFVVVHVDIKYRRSAKLGDTVEVVSSAHKIKHASMSINQRIEKDGELMAEAIVTIAMVDNSHKPIRLPSDLKEAMQDSIS
jgi:acyl-CoA thioester hydrolase